MKLAAASVVLVLVLGSSAFAQEAEVLSQTDKTRASTFNVFTAFGATFFKPFGDSPDEVLPGAPDGWEIRGWDITVGARAKGHLRGPFYLGGGAAFSFGGADDHYSSDTVYADEDYWRLGFDGYFEFGVRFPVGTRHHFDLGARLGGTADYGDGTSTTFSYHDAIAWFGPAIALEPNAGTPGFIATGAVKFPVVGFFESENLFEQQWNVDGGYIARVELGYVFERRFTLVGYFEFGGYEFENDNTDGFEQERLATGLEVRFTY